MKQQNGERLMVLRVRFQENEKEYWESVTQNELDRMNEQLAGLADAFANEEFANRRMTGSRIADFLRATVITNLTAYDVAHPDEFEDVDDGDYH